jgi:hypothetical protein
VEAVSGVGKFRRGADAYGQVPLKSLRRARAGVRDNAGKRPYAYLALTLAVVVTIPICRLFFRFDGAKSLISAGFFIADSN